MDTITITARIESPADNGGREWLAYIDQSTKPVGGCVMGRGSDAVSAARDLERRAQWQIDGDYGHGAYTVAMGPQPKPEPAYNLVPDGRDIDRLVDVMGNEIRTVMLPDGKIVARLPMDNYSELGTFTQDEWDAILSEGIQRPLDTIAGTIVTAINW